MDIEKEYRALKDEILVGYSDRDGVQESAFRTSFYFWNTMKFPCIGNNFICGPVTEFQKSRNPLAYSNLKELPGIFSCSPNYSALLLHLVTF
jgi:hypothetical protein